MEHDIAIIGAGASAISLLAALKEEALAASLSAISIALWGRPESFATGEVFGTATPEHGVNTPATMLGLTETDPVAFVRWLEGQGRTGDSYPPRTAMGRFLAQSYGRLLGGRQLDVTEMREEAVDLQASAAGAFAVLGAHGARASARCVVLCLGAVAGGGLTQFAGLRGYRARGADVGPIDGARVLIAGAGPSAIDAFRNAMAGGAREVHMFSRHGYPPTCQSAAPSYLPSQFTWPTLQGQWRAGALGMKRALVLFRRELREIGPRGEYEPAMTRLERDGLTSCLSYLLQRARQAELPVQDLLVTTRPYMHRLWGGLRIDDRRRFDHEWRSLWSAWRHPVPIVVYHQLLDAARAGRLRLHRVVQAPMHADGQFSIRPLVGRSVHAPVLLDATGGAACVDADAMPLLRALHCRGMVDVHPCGGIDIDPMSLQCRVRGRHVCGLFALGPVTRGALFSTNAQWFNARCAAHWARWWVTEAACAKRAGPGAQAR